MRRIIDHIVRLEVVPRQAHGYKIQRYIRVQRHSALIRFTTKPLVVHRQSISAPWNGQWRDLCAIAGQLDFEEHTRLLPPTCSWHQNKRIVELVDCEIDGRLSLQ